MRGSSRLTNSSSLIQALSADIEFLGNNYNEPDINAARLLQTNHKHQPEFVGTQIHKH